MNLEEPIKLKLDTLKGDQSFFYTAIVNKFIPIADNIDLTDGFIEDTMNAIKANMEVDLNKALKAALSDIKKMNAIDTKSKIIT